MSDFPSISDLKTNKKSKKDNKKSDSSNSKIFTNKVQEKFKKKMSEVDSAEREREAGRLSAQIGYPHIDLAKFPVGQEALRQVSKELAEDLSAICFFVGSDQVRVGAIDPTKLEVQELLKDLEKRNYANGELYVISKNSLDRVLKLYENLPIIKPITKDIEIKEKDLEKVQASITDFKSFQSILDEKSTTDLVTLLLGVALKLDASDLHIEAEEDGVVIRLRLDGILHDAAILPKEIFAKLVSRIKLVSSLKININDKPQDGRFTIKLSSGEVDVRVSTMPTVYGESAVMRLLHQNREGLTLESLGLRGEAFEILKREIKRPNGMIITTGPTGSGKTTTLYSVMQLLNKPGVKIITLEDPVEYKMEGINQSQVDKKKDYTFARGLKSILRQDPDIAMVGEIRDLETAEIAVQSALTGHLILSTIHTNSAAGAIPRFLSMGVKPFLLAPSLNCVIGQRLVRRLCEKCKEEDILSDERNVEVSKILEKMPDNKKVDIKDLKFYKANGCEECGGLGYKGRVGIFEIFVIVPELEETILSSKVSEFEVEKLAVNNGMITMVQDGILKASEGITTLDEVFRVIE